MIKQKSFCTVPHCNYPVGECLGTCYSDDEQRIDIIGLNGNDGLHYDAVPAEVDMVNHPPHYTQGGIECIDAIKASMTPAQFKGYLKGNVMKYLWRLDHKNDAEENAEKALWYLKKLMEVL